MSDRYWPLAGLSLTTPDLVLRPMAETDLTALADLLPADVEFKPGSVWCSSGDEQVDRGLAVHQNYWSACGTWRPEHWRLPFVVRRGPEILGVQELEGTSFLTLRTVDSSSFLATAARGRKFGQQMRAAVLALAFGPLAAQVAITSAWHDNHASLGVSRALGYQPNGMSLDARGDGADVMMHLRLTRDGWLASGLGGRVQIDGFGPCRALFGLPPQ